MAVPSFAASLLKRMPPWLRRTHGEKLVLGLGGPLDTVADLSVEGVKARLPSDTVEATALSAIGRERRIRRGPGESDLTYARRIRTWLDAHRRRGNAYVLLEQLRAYWLESLNVQRDVVAESGLRISMDEAGVVTRDVISWDASALSGTSLAGRWSHVWLFFHLDDLAFLSSILATEGGDYFVTDGGDLIVAIVTGGTLDGEVAEEFRAIPREWSAAHLPYITIVLLHGVARLWGYPVPVPTWGTWGTWQSPDPYVLTTED